MFAGMADIAAAPPRASDRRPRDLPEESIVALADRVGVAKVRALNLLACGVTTGAPVADWAGHTLSRPLHCFLIPEHSALATGNALAQRVAIGVRRAWHELNATDLTFLGEKRGG